MVVKFFYILVCARGIFFSSYASKVYLRVSLLKGITRFYCDKSRVVILSMFLIHYC